MVLGASVYKFPHKNKSALGVKKAGSRYAEAVFIKYSKLETKHITM